MTFERQVVFWLAALAVIVLLLWLLSEILLPFVAGAAIAYLLTPVTDRLERLGVNRLAAALLIITFGGDGDRHRHPAGGADPGRPVVVLHRQYPRLCDAAAIAAQRSEPAVAAENPGRQLQRRQIDRRSGDARGGLAHRLPAVAVVGRPRAGLAVLAGGGDAGGRVLSDLRLAPHDPHRRQLDPGATSAKPCASSRARSTPPLPASCAGRPRSA